MSESLAPGHTAATSPAAAANDAAGRPLRRWVYALLIALATAQVAGRLAAVNSVDRAGAEPLLKQQGRADWQRQRPFLSANDRSRWCTIRALVEHGTYAIDAIVVQPGWDTIDMVKHDGHLYSSKPPLLATAMAGQYWLIHRITGATLASHPYEIARVMLATWNLLPWAGMLWLLGTWAERYGRGDFARIYLVAAAAFGTFLGTFAVTLNNHLPAAVCTALAGEAWLRLVVDGDRRRRWFLLAGLASALAAANELPALSFTAVVLAWCGWCDWRRTLVVALPGVALVAAAALGTNYLAHGTWRPAYAQRTTGEDWYDYTYEVNGRIRESYWRHRVGIDRGEASRARYAWHVLLGHHGVFSLTPVWCLAVGGWRRPATAPRERLAACLLSVAAVSLLCLAFYLARPLADRNYGGMTAGFRWLFWLTPLWALSMLPALERLAAGPRAARLVALAALAMSTFSAAYPTWNPWTHPWIFNWLWYQGSIRF